MQFLLRAFVLKCFTAILISIGRGGYYMRMRMLDHNLCQNTICRIVVKSRFMQAFP